MTEKKRNSGWIVVGDSGGTRRKISEAEKRRVGIINAKDLLNEDDKSRKPYSI